MTKTNSSIKTTILMLLALAFLQSVAQDRAYSEFNKKSIRTNNAGMYVLGSWAVANLIIGGIGWHQNSGDTRYFHQMNVFWNTVNLSIAGFALYNNLAGGSESLTNEMIMNNQYKAEKLYLINGGLDLVYIGAGFLMKNISSKKEKTRNLLKGYGNSLILQGSFLLGFDMIMWGIQRHNRLHFFDNVDISFSQVDQLTEIGIALTF